MEVVPLDLLIKNTYTCEPMIFDRQGFYTTFKSITKNGLSQSGDSECIQNSHNCIPAHQAIFTCTSINANANNKVSIKRKLKNGFEITCPQAISLTRNS